MGKTYRRKTYEEVCRNASGSILILALSLTTALAAHTHTWGAWAWEKSQHV